MGIIQLSCKANQLTGFKMTLAFNGISTFNLRPVSTGYSIRSSCFGSKSIAEFQKVNRKLYAHHTALCTYGITTCSSY